MDKDKVFYKVSKLCPLLSRKSSGGFKELVLIWQADGVLRLRLAQNSRLTPKEGDKKKNSAIPWNY